MDANQIHDVVEQIISVLASKGSVDKIQQLLQKLSHANILKVSRMYTALTGSLLDEELQLIYRKDPPKQLISLLMPMDILLSTQIRKSVEGAGTDESSLILLVMLASPAQREQVKQTYQNLYSVSVYDDICGDISNSPWEQVIKKQFEPSYSHFDPNSPVTGKNLLHALLQPDDTFASIQDKIDPQEIKKMKEPTRTVFSLSFLRGNLLKKIQIAEEYSRTLQNGLVKYKDRAELIVNAFKRDLDL
ncbi:Annexin_2 [Hexamita inflata]|uniref:Annexin 2 n=1 Tax=Hexamita inflata TaxID=28002 RepID=A0AA86UR80_9EUKA|nr:Annexin 2 [Hexamita inflata]